MANIIEKIEKFFGQDEKTKSEKLLEAATRRANSMYNIIKEDGVGIVLIDGKPSSTDWDTDAEKRLYRLREMYVERCVKLGELL